MHLQASGKNKKYWIYFGQKPIFVNSIHNARQGDCSSRCCYRKARWILWRTLIDRITPHATFLQMQCKPMASYLFYVTRLTKPNPHKKRPVRERLKCWDGYYSLWDNNMCLRCMLTILIWLITIYVWGGDHYFSIGCKKL